MSAYRAVLNLLFQTAPMLAAKITERFKMIALTLRASTVACVLALLASPAIADTVSITVRNNSGLRITDLYIDGATVPQWTVARLGAGQGLDHGNHMRFLIESDSTCEYDIRYISENDVVPSISRFYIFGCGDDWDVNLN